MNVDNERMQKMQDEREKLLKAYQQVFTTPAGELVWNNLKKICMYEDVTIFTNCPYETAFNEGKRSVFSLMNKLIKPDPHNVDNQ